MSALRRRSRRLAAAATAAPSPSTPPPAHLLDLPTDLLVRALSLRPRRHRSRRGRLAPLPRLTADGNVWS